MSEVFIHEESGLHIDRAVKILSGMGYYGWRNANRALRSAAERAASSGLTQAGRFASSRYNISKSAFMSHVRAERSVTGGGHSGGDISVQISFAGNVIPLIEFQTRFSKDGGVSASVKKGSSGVLSHAFVANIGGTSVYERITTRRFPVEKKYGPSAAHMMMDETVVQKMDEHITKVFNERLEHEITRVLNGW